MPHSWRRVIVLFFSMSAFAGCSSDGGAGLPSVALFADPEVCDLPCEVVFDSGVEAEGRAITFTWDFGDGPVDGQERMRHRFEGAGPHEVSLLVANEGQSSSETISVLVEAQPSASAQVDEAGGAVSLGAAMLTVPAEVAPETVEIELTELPSMGDAAARVLDANRFSPLGHAYQVSTRMKSSAPLDLAVTLPEAAGKSADELAWLVRRVGRPVLAETEPPFPSRAPIVDYVLLPVTRVDADGTAHGDIFGRRRVQLVELSEPLDVQALDLAEPTASASGAFQVKAAPPPFVYVLFWDTPAMGRNAFADAVKEGVAESYNLLVASMGFVGPRGTLTVVVGTHPKPKWLGAVAHDDNQTIRLTQVMKTADQVKKVVAHEYFHLIQNLNNNETSILGYWDEDIWFMEGAADWACDEVFDTTPGYYHPTRWRRFETRLNQSGAKNNGEYQTVGFWKWAESLRKGTVRKIIEHKYLLTHTTPPGARTMVENSEAVNNLDVLTAIWSDIDFLSYVYEARYEKDFELDEKGSNELWGNSPYLGPQQEVYVLDSKDDSVADQLPGDSELNPLKMSYTLKEELTAEALRIGNLDLEGNLRIRFSKTPGAPIDAHVLMLDATTGELLADEIVRDLSKEHSDLSMSFKPGREAVIFVADGRWEYSEVPIPTSGEILAWVEDPCGAIPAHDIEVTTEAELQSALRNMPDGAVIKLAAGTYTPTGMSWPIDELGFDSVDAVLVVKNMTLIGAGAESTTLNISGDPVYAYLYTWGDATLRNLTVRMVGEGVFFSLNAGNVSMCNVDLDYPANPSAGYEYNAYRSGSFSLNLYETSITRASGSTGREAGVRIYGCNRMDQDAFITANIYESSIRGWTWGVTYDAGPIFDCNGDTTVNTDCEGFSNELFNVQEARYPSPTEVVTRELCPAP